MADGYTKKRLLFIMDTFPLGGISKSLLALFNVLGDQYEIDFLLMKQTGMFIPMLPPNVHLLDEPIERIFREPHPKNVLTAFRELSFRRWLLWCYQSLHCSVGRLIGGVHRQIQYLDLSIAKNARKLSQHYDAGIAYQGGRCIYYLALKVNAERKIAYVHSNYTDSEMDYMLKPVDKQFFPLMDHIDTISDVCLSSLRMEFPELPEKICVVENICSVETIRKMAENGDSYSDGYEGVRIATMGRLDILTKGMDFVVDACKELRDRGFAFRWYIIGDGNGRQKIEELIAEKGMQDSLLLLGAKSNPYPYIKDADIYVQPSRYEGKSVALDEAKALGRPIVVTDFHSVWDQFVDRKTALICGMDAKEIADRIEELIIHPELRRELSFNLSREKVGNEEQAEIFKDLIGDRI